MRKIFAVFLMLLLAVSNAAISEEFRTVWLWDIPLFQDVDLVIPSISQSTNIVLEQDERLTFRYKPTIGSPDLNINKIPFNIEITAFSYDDDLAIGLNIPEGKTYGISLRLEHSSEFENHPDSMPEKFEKESQSCIETIYKMLESKFGAPIASYLHIQNGNILGTSTIFDQEIGKWEYFSCPTPYNIDLKQYKESGASAISFNYCWGNISMENTFCPDKSFRIVIEEKCWPTVTFAVFEQTKSDNKGDYFDYVEKHLLGITSF